MSFKKQAAPPSDGTTLPEEYNIEIFGAVLPTLKKWILVTPTDSHKICADHLYFSLWCQNNEHL